MNVLFVSQCTKRALTETRRILDQFAERRGERTWQTTITQAGLDTVRSLLRKTARKNTAVACHWIRARDHSELLWVVGDARQFNAEGAIPTNVTTHDGLRANDENTWHYLPLISALTALAALLHDLGKATQAFQDRLHKPYVGTRNHYRHEWVSVRLLQAFIGEDNDTDWLQRLAGCADDSVDVKDFEAQWLQRLHRDGITDKTWTFPEKQAIQPFACMPPLAKAVAWLVLTHHRLPCKPVENLYAPQEDGEGSGPRQQYRPFGSTPRSIRRHELQELLTQLNADWNEPREYADEKELQVHWHFPHGLPVTQFAWRKQAARHAKKLLALLPMQEEQPCIHDPFIMHVSRMCLMLADHYYSRLGIGHDGQPVPQRQRYLVKGAKLVANTVTDRNTGHRINNQTLDEHLLGVQAHASIITHALPSLASSLPAMQNHKGLKKRSTDRRFQWQDKAADLASSVRQRTTLQGAFIVNMASTGCGKTLGNARIMNELADPARGMRCAFAVGLRTLTLQTGRCFQKDLGLTDDQLAIQVGGSANRELFEYWERLAEASGSASSQALLDEGGQVIYEGDDCHPVLERLVNDVQTRRLIATPLLVCTVDHLTPATESLRGGRQIAPMLRLLTSDLVLDEPDDFDMSDLPALTRLVHWAGMLGSRVLLSSATLPPALVHGLFRAYRAGRAVFQKHRSERPHDSVNVCCLWVDEFHQQAWNCAKSSEFSEKHEEFIRKRVNKLAQAARDEPRRLAQIVRIPETLEAANLDKQQRRYEFARFLLRCAWNLHQIPQNHGIDSLSGKRVSFGLIRMANIAPLYDVALALYADGAPAPGVRVHLCVYHSQYPLLARSIIEQKLDTILNRRPLLNGADPALRHPSVRALLDGSLEQDHLFIVLGSPVTEVGRDHDYDWAVVEPSSMRSLIQLAGRVRRHRPQPVQQVNVQVLDTNIRALELRGKSRSGDAAYCRPGFELSDAEPQFHFRSHSLSVLLGKQLQEWGSVWPVDARPRIVECKKRPKENTANNWIDLEHARMRDTMLPRRAGSTQHPPVRRDASLAWYEPDPEHPQCLWLTGVLPQYQRFREDDMRDVDVVFLPNEDDEQLLLHRIIDRDRGQETLYVCDDATMLTRIPDEQLMPTPQHTVQPWLQPDLLLALQEHAREQHCSLEQCAKRYTIASLPATKQGWCWHAALGFNRIRS